MRSARESPIAQGVRVFHAKREQGLNFHRFLLKFEQIQNLREHTRVTESTRKSPRVRESHWEHTRVAESTRKSSRARENARVWTFILRVFRPGLDVFFFRKARNWSVKFKFSGVPIFDEPCTKLKKIQSFQTREMVITHLIGKHKSNLYWLRTIRGLLQIGEFNKSIELIKISILTLL